MKKIIYLFVLLIPFLVKAEEIESITTKYYKTIQMIPNNYSIQSTNISLSESYEITEEEYNNGQEENSRNSIITETTYKKMTVTIAKASSLYKYTIHLHWKNIPSTRSYDIIGLAYNNNVEAAMTPVFEQEYCRSSGSCYTSYTHYGVEQTNSVSAIFLLPTGTLTSLDQTLFVLVGKKNSNNTITSQQAVGDYAHAIHNVSLSDASNYIMNISGLNLDSSIIDDYDEISIAMSTWSGTW